MNYLSDPSQRFSHTLRSFSVFALLLFVLVSLSGCISGTQPAQPASSEEPSLPPDNSKTVPASAANNNQNRVIKHLSGETTIVGTPTKIAVLDYRLADSLVALGIKPYAMTTYLGNTNLPYLDGKPLADAIPLGDTVNIEAALQAAPDLIIARVSEQKIYDQLSKIAPTLILDVPSDWRQSLRDLGTILQRDKEADTWLADYDKKAESVRNEVAPYVKPSDTYLYLRVMPKEIRVHYTKELFSATLFQDVSLTPAPGLDQVKKIEPISLEKLPDFDADHIFLQVGSPTVGGDPKAEENLKTLSQTTIWKNLKAVKSGHVYVLPQWVISDYPNIKSKSLNLIRENLMKSGSVVK
jgi:iron complex transport system substrate-binding protein